MRLYPGAKVLVATKRDFEPARRKKFCARIATGDYDAVIIGHSQFEKIPLSPERQPDGTAGSAKGAAYHTGKGYGLRHSSFRIREMLLWHEKAESTLN